MNAPAKKVVLLPLLTEDPGFDVPTLSQLSGGENFKRQYASNRQFMEADLKRSGLVAEDIAARPVMDMSKIVSFATAAYFMPFFDLSGRVIKNEKGRPLMWSQRREIKPGYEKEPEHKKYDRPGLKESLGFAHYPYLHPAVWNMREGSLNICEGEKKTAATLLIANQPAMGITGKDVGKETLAILIKAIEQYGAKTILSEILLWPDADIARYDVFRSYGSTASRLANYFLIPVKIMHPGWDTKKYKGIDDALGAGVSWEEICSAGEVQEELALPPSYMAEVFGLQATISKDKSVKLLSNEYNYLKVLRNREQWGEWGVNTDTRTTTLNGSEISHEHDSATIAARFQSRFAMSAATVDRLWHCVVSVAERNHYSPWSDYLNSLKWDGTKRIDRLLTEACGAADDDFTREASRKFLAAIVARSLSPGCAVDWMLITCGPQGCGKSSLPAALMGERWAHLTQFSTGAVDKDLVQIISRSKIVNFDEMSVFFRKADETEFLKELVTRRTDTFRVPYGKQDKDYPRAGVLYGSTNRDDLIKPDESGYRRWVVVPVQGVVQTQFGLQFDWSWIEENREQLWAEAVEAYRGGIDVSQVAGATINAAAFVQENPMEHIIRAALKTINKFAPLCAGATLTYNEIWGCIGDATRRDDGKNKQVSRFLTEMRCEKSPSKKNGRGVIVSQFLVDFLKEWEK